MSSVLHPCPRAFGIWLFLSEQAGQHVSKPLSPWWWQTWIVLWYCCHLQMIPPFSLRVEQQANACQINHSLQQRNRQPWNWASSPQLKQMERPVSWYHALDEHEHCVIQSGPVLHCASWVFGKCHNPNSHKHKMGEQYYVFWSTEMKTEQQCVLCKLDFVRIVKNTAHQSRERTRWHCKPGLCCNTSRLHRHHRPPYSVADIQNWLVKRSEQCHMIWSVRLIPMNPKLFTCSSSAQWCVYPKFIYWKILKCTKWLFLMVMYYHKTTFEHLSICLYYQRLIFIQITKRHVGL